MVTSLFKVYGAGRHEGASYHQPRALGINFVFRAIFDLSNKIALLILRRMYALYVKKKTKTEILSKE